MIAGEARLSERGGVLFVRRTSERLSNEASNHIGTTPGLKSSLVLADKDCMDRRVAFVFIILLLSLLLGYQNCALIQL
jgi:hypothetical protein